MISLYFLFCNFHRDLVVVENPEESVSGEKWVATGKLRIDDSNWT